MRCALLLGALVLLEACSSGRSDSILEDALLGPGSALGEHFVVPDGSRLIGSRFPDAYTEGGWSALLLIDGDPLGVLEDLIAQAEASGLVVPAGQLRPCRIDRETLLACELSPFGTDPNIGYTFMLRWGHDGDVSYRHLRVSAGFLYADADPHIDDGTMDERPDLRLELPPAPDPIDAWDAPATGEAVATLAVPLPDRVVKVEPGSRVVAPNAPAPCVTGGYETVLRVTGDLDDVVARYKAQFDARGFVGEVVTGSFQGRRFVVARSGGAGAGNLDAIGLDRTEDDPSLLLLARCND